jgi:hypothetical protein
MARVTNVYLTHNVQTDSGALQASYPIGTGGSFPRYVGGV